MKTLPSKELLSEVLRYEITNASLDDTQQTPYINVYINNELLIYDCINIYELAHQCKEWALDKGYSIESYLEHKTSIAAITSIDSDNPLFGTKHYYLANTEPEAIFKACEWIMEQIK